MGRAFDWQQEYRGFDSRPLRYEVSESRIPLSPNIQRKLSQRTMMSYGQEGKRSAENYSNLVCSEER